MDDGSMQYGDDYKYIPVTSIGSGMELEIADGVFYKTIQIVNVCIVRSRHDPGQWVLIDGGMPKSAEEILSFAEDIMGKGSRPKAIILTHGHFDHVGSLIELIQHWGIEVYAHPLELPYLIGEKNYPEPDASVEGGLVAKVSTFFPNDAIDLGKHVKSLPEDGSVPGLDEWTWIHTPGHSPGHISLWRNADKALIAGDAFVSVKQDELYDVLTQKMEINGPPRYFTTNWTEAEQSVKNLANLEPAMAITGHGKPVSGFDLINGLNTLANNFREIAKPDHGKYVNREFN
jgi:glyoxylase-like metal-dependent hydrolase (beta-lactamase superfamily II)